MIAKIMPGNKYVFSYRLRLITNAKLCKRNPKRIGKNKKQKQRTIIAIVTITIYTHRIYVVKLLLLTSLPSPSFLVP